jgi:cyclopropane fatty-acyl-phospholipid synthase-like methyltransferase
VEMARKAAASVGVNAKFLLMDAEEMEFDELFDVVWSVESISHYPHRESFFASAAKCLKSGGTLAIIDWFKKGELTERDYNKFIQPIEKGMLVELDTMKVYGEFLSSNGFQAINNEVLNKNCAKTWDLCLDMLKNKALWRVAAENGSKFVDFLRAFRAMRAGFASGNFVYGLMIAKRM